MKLALLLSSVLALAATTSAQTTGVPGVNDLTVNATGSGGTSCQFLTLTGGGTVTINIDTLPGLSTVFFLSPFCRCTDGSVIGAPPPFVFAPSPSCGIPYTAGGGTSNQSFDIITGLCGPILSAPVVSDPSGQATISFPIPAGFVFTVQGGIIHPCATGFPAIFTQSFSVVS